MIVTITLNASIDTEYFLDNLVINGINRVEAPIRAGGGKGINCARAAALMGAEVLVTGLVAGNSGEWIVEDLKKEGYFAVEMAKIIGESRTSLTLMHDKNKQTEIIENGPRVNENDLSGILKKIQNHKDEISLVCISGSVNSEDDLIYVKLIHRLREILSKRAFIFLDTSGVKLIRTLSSTDLPDFVKPNEEELGTLVGKSIRNKKEALDELRGSEVLAKIPNVLISFGGEGAVAKWNQDFYDISIPKIDIVNTTGSGDSTTAGVAYAFEKKMSSVETLKLAMACGMSNAQHRELGRVIPEDVKALMQEIEVIEI